jgi:hypothetical protein
VSLLNDANSQPNNCWSFDALALGKRRGLQAADVSYISELILLVRRWERSGERRGEKIPENCSRKGKRGYNCYRSRMGSPGRMGRRIATDRRIRRGRQIRSIMIYSAVWDKPRKNHTFSQSENMDYMGMLKSHHDSKMSF